MSLGGVGLFLLGMIMLTDGLRHLAGGSLRRALAHYTRTPVSGAAAGALTTALIQSSSATTVMAVGFVGAGLLSFSNALGIIFGANIGTTITGWLVAILGFKLDIGLMVLPFLLVGALMRMFGSERIRHLGAAVAGFSLLFVGIETMQQGLSAFEGIVTPDTFPPDTLGGRLLLLLIGVLITLVTQSSSAGVATAMTALATGTISFPQAAAMVIGMDVGTTFTAALATVGGSTSMRQTGFAHVIYNMLTGIMAFMLLGPYTAFAGDWATSGGAGTAQIALVGFHTIFNTLGVILVLPFAGAFARFIMRVVPQRGPALEQGLDPGLLKDPAVAADAAAGVVRAIGREVFRLVEALLDPDPERRIDRIKVEATDRAIKAALDYVEKIVPESGDSETVARHGDSLHVLDHLSRLHHRCSQTERVDALFEEHRLRRLAVLLRAHVLMILDEDSATPTATRLDRLHKLMGQQRSLVRNRTIRAAADGGMAWPDTVLSLDGARWLHRVAYHVWRIMLHDGALGDGRRSKPRA